MQISVMTALPRVRYSAPRTKLVSLDKGAMSATGVLATTALDRHGDILEVAGIDTGSHRRNPIALWNHGVQLAIPIGKCEDPAGRYTVEIDPESGECRCTTFFSQHLPEAEQIYHLIDEGVIRAMSIGFRPLAAKPLPAQRGSLQRPGSHIQKCELLEASWVAVPANQDAIRRTLSKSLVCGKSLSPAIRRALAPLVSTTAVTRGFTLSKTQKGSPMSQTTKTKADDELAPVPSADSPPAADTAPVEAPPAMPLGAEILTQVHQGLIGVVDYCNGEIGRLENERLEPFLVELCEETFEKLAAIEQMFAAEYPDLDPLPEVQAPEPDDKPEGDTPAEGESKEAGDKPDDKPKDEPEAEKSGSKSYPVGHKRFTKAQGTCLKEAADALGEMSGAENLDKTQKVTLRYYARELGQMVPDEPADEAQKGEPDGDLSPEQKRLVEARIKKLELLVAHRKRLARMKARKN